MVDLNEVEREAVLLRFFERSSLAEIGRKLGLRENAARMRVEFTRGGDGSSPRLRAERRTRGRAVPAPSTGIRTGRGLVVR